MSASRRRPGTQNSRSTRPDGRDASAAGLRLATGSSDAYGRPAWLLRPARGVGSRTLRTVDSALWIGAVTGLAGAAVGGAISYLVSVQQIRDAHAQRQDADRFEQARRSLDRRSAAYADFLTHARQFRNAVRRPHHPEAGLRVAVQEIDTLANSADAAGSLVFLLAESNQTEAACGAVMRTIGQVVGGIHDGEADPDQVHWDELNEQMSRRLREFQTAARAELHIHSVESPA